MFLVPVALALTLSQTPTTLEVNTAALQLLTDGKGHYVAFDPVKAYAGEAFSSGDGKTFYKLRVSGGGRSGDEQWSLTMWDPRVLFGDTGPAEVWMKDSGASFMAVCGRRQTALTLVPADETKKLFAAATFLPPRWTRLPEKLLRDEEGNYYLVDRYRAELREDRRDFRVFVGPRGRMKQVPLKEIVDDSEGMILTTKSGNLRLVTTEGKFEAKWVQNGKARTLTELDLDRFDTGRLIYMDLGPYVGQRLGTPCDDLM